MVLAGFFASVFTTILVYVAIAVPTAEISPLEQNQFLNKNETQWFS